LFSEVEPSSPPLYFCVGAAFSYFDAVSRTLLTEVNHPRFNPGLILFYYSLPVGIPHDLKSLPWRGSFIEH
jgi:hypothetical protein